MQKTKSRVGWDGWMTKSARAGLAGKASLKNDMMAMTKAAQSLDLQRVLFAFFFFFGFALLCLGSFALFRRRAGIYKDILLF